MPWRSHGKARVNASAPEAFGKCDRCQMLFSLNDLTYQKDWSGPALINKRLKVCSPCLDKPQPQLKDKRIQSDGLPVKDPRPLNNLTLEGGGEPIVDSVLVLIDEPLP